MSKIHTCCICKIEFEVDTQYDIDIEAEGPTVEPVCMGCESMMAGHVID